MLSDKLRWAVERVPQDVRECTAAQLRIKHNLKPTRVDYSLRASFWREFDKCWEMKKPRIVTCHIFAGVCSETYFYNVFLIDMRRVAWLVLPQQTYVKEMEALLARGTERLWEILGIDLKDERGKIDPKRGELLLKAVGMLNDRVKGLAVQRIQKASLHVQATTTSRALPEETMEQLQARLKELEGVGGADGGRVEITAGEGGDLVFEAQEERQVIDVTPIRSPGKNP